MATYTRKPSGPIEGFKWVGCGTELPAWADEEGLEIQGDRLIVPNAAGAIVAHIGDHVLRPKPGDCYVVEGEYIDELFNITD